MRKTLFEEMIDGMIINRVVRDYEFNMVSKHFHNEYEIYYLVKGQRYYFIENKTYLVNEGSLVIINHNQIHKTELAGDPYHDRILIQLSSDYLAPIFCSLGETSIETYFSQNSGVLVLNEEDQAKVEKLLFCMVEEIKNKSPGYKLATYMKLIELLIYAMRLKEKERQNPFLAIKPSQSEKHKKIHEITAYIYEHYAHIGSLDELSKQFYISKCYLSRIFKEATGFTVNEYLHIYKVKKAQELLASSTYNVSEIATLVGYNSISSFQNAFKKYADTSPLQYRKKLTYGIKNIPTQKDD